MRYVLIMSFLMVSSCSLKKTAENMEATTNKIGQNSEHLSKRTDDLEGDAIKRETNETMNENLAVLFDKSLFGGPTDEQMNKAAGTIMESMYYQFWRGDFGDDMLELDERGVLSILPLLTELKGQIPADYNVAPLIPNRNYRAIGILATELDRTIPEFDRIVESKGLPRLSVYDLMVEALKNRDDLKRSEVMPQTASQILLFEPQVRYLLQMRHNFLVTKVLCFLTDISSRDIFGKLDLLVGNTLFGQWHDISQYNNEQLIQWSKWLRGAAETRRVLKEDLGLEPQYNWQLMQIFKGQHFTGENEILKMKADKAVMTERQKIELEFIEAGVAVK